MTTHLPPLNWAEISFLCGILPVTTLSTWCVCRYTDWLKPRPEEGPAEPPRTYTPPPHTCVVDYERSQISVLPSGAVLVTCAVTGCGNRMVLGRNIASTYHVGERAA